MTVQLNNIVRTSTGTVGIQHQHGGDACFTGAVPLIVYFVSGKWFVARHRRRRGEGLTP